MAEPEPGPAVAASVAVEPVAAEPARPVVAVPPDPLRINLAVDLSLIALGAAVGLGTEFVGKEQRWAGCGACDRSAINALDRSVIGKQSAPAVVVSDIGMISAIALPFALDLGDALIQRSRDQTSRRNRHVRSWGKATVILLETFAMTYATTNLVKFAVRRPRPYSYDPDNTVGDPGENDARLSFFSGHSSLAFAMASAYASVFQARHPRSRWVAPIWVLGMSVASITAVARVEAGKHFWTDVITGAVVGTAIGVAVPALHRTTPFGRKHLAVRLAPSRTGALVLAQGVF